MKVHYTPPLDVQIRGHRQQMHELTSTPVVIYILSCADWIYAVDSETQKATKDRQQFLRGTDGSLKILSRWQWVDHPIEIQTGSYSFG
jgi:hypothetical protein